MLFNIMMSYSVSHPTPGYRQGMSDLLTPLIYVFDDESMSYILYCSLMSRYLNEHFQSDDNEVTRRLTFFRWIVPSIDPELAKIFHTSDSHYFLYRWFLLDCKREFSRFDDVLRVLELVWLYSIERFAKNVVTGNNPSMFVSLLSISILQEDRELLLSSTTSEEDLNKYFFSSSSQRRRRSTKRILQRAQFYQALYSSPIDQKHE
jgi:hypothetical protein